MPGPGVPAQLPGNVPARPPGRPGSGMANSRRCRRWPVRELPTEIVELGRRDNGPGGPAQDADLAETPVRAWAKQAGPDAEAGSGGRLSCADRRELAKLRRENRRLRDNVETLKRAAAIFATAAR